MILRVVLLVVLLIAMLVLAISVQRETLATMPTGAVYLFVGSLGVILTVLIVSVVLVVMNHE